MAPPGREYPNVRGNFIQRPPSTPEESPRQFSRPAPRPGQSVLPQRTDRAPTPQTRSYTQQRRPFFRSWNDWQNRRRFSYPYRPYRRFSRVIFIGGFPCYFFPYGNCFYYGGYYHAYWAGSYDEPADYPTLYQLGYDWGRRVREQDSAWSDFVDYVARYIVPSPEAGIDEFRDGFREGYDASNADDVFAQAFDQAAGNAPE